MPECKVLLRRLRKVSNIPVIKNGLSDDILRIEQQVDRMDDLVRLIEDSVDVSIRESEADVRRLIKEAVSDIRILIDAAEVRFENQKERVRSSQAADMKELEERQQTLTHC